MLKHLGIENLMDTVISPLTGKCNGGPLKTFELYLDFDYLDEIKSRSRTLYKQKLCGEILTKLLNIAVEDVIDNKNTFFLPSRTPSMIEMYKMSREEFQKARKNGKFLDYDLIECHFTGAIVQFRYKKRRGFRTKEIHLNKRLKEKLKKNTYNRLY